MKKILVCFILLVSVWFCFAEPQVKKRMNSTQKIVSINTTALTFDYKVPAGWHVVCITAVDRNDIIVVLEKKVTHEQHKEQKIVSINTTALTFDYKVPAGWHVVCITAVDRNDIIVVLEKN